LNGLQDSLLHQQTLLAKAAEHAQAADLAEGLAILAGELTAEQSEEIRRQHREEMARDPNLANTEELPARRAEADARLANVRIDLAQAGDSLVRLHVAQETCKGPSVSLIGRLALRVNELRLHGLPILDSSEASIRARYTKCSSRAAKAALCSMPKISV
jgi:hypothetical protein